MLLNINTILIIGISATVITGYLGSVHYLKYKNATGLNPKQNSNNLLTKTLVRKYGDLEIKLQGTRVDKNLIVLKGKGTFVNNNSAKPAPSPIHKSIRIELPENYLWSWQKTRSLSDGLNIELTQTENKVVITWNLFKEGKAFTFDSLVKHKSNLKNKQVDHDNNNALLEGIHFTRCSQDNSLAT